MIELNLDNGKVFGVGKHSKSRMGLCILNISCFPCMGITVIIKHQKGKNLHTAEGHEKPTKKEKVNCHIIKNAGVQKHSAGTKLTLIHLIQLLVISVFTFLVGC